MSRAFLGLFFTLSLFSKSSFWNYSYSYTLKKDQVARVVIKKDYLPTIKKEGILEFRWTLYKGDKLVLLVDYEGFPTQHLIEKRYRRDTVKVKLLGDYPSISKEAFAIIRFRDFKNKKATFDVMVRDPEHRMEVRFK
jgi:hypothetical protein